MSYTYNPFTDNLDLKGTGGGGGSSISLTPDTGSTLTGNAFDVLGQTSGSAQAMETVTDSGKYFIENRTIQTPYVVDASSTVGERGTYTTIQAAINAAVADGASNSVFKEIYIRPGTYTEDLTIPSGIILSGLVLSNPSGGFITPINQTLISGNHTLSATFIGGFNNINFQSISGDLFVDDTVAFLYGFNCSFRETAANLFNFTGQNSFLSLTNCTLLSASQTIITLSGGGGICRIKDSTFPQGGTISQSSSRVQLENCQGLDTVDSTDGFVEISNCNFSGISPNFSGNAQGYIRRCNFEGVASALYAIANTMLCSISGCTSGDPSLGTNRKIWQDGLHIGMENEMMGNVVMGIPVTVFPDNLENFWQFLEVTPNANPSTINVRDTTDYNEGQVFTIKDISGNASTNNIVLQGIGTMTFDGAASITLNQDYAWVVIRWNGTEFNVIGRGP